jgi:hypothetical protein
MEDGDVGNEMDRRQPRKSYRGDHYPRYDDGLTRRSALRRLGGLGGLVLLGTGPFAAALAARADEEGWYVTVPPWDEWRTVYHGEQPVYYRVILDVASDDIAACVEGGADGLIEAIDGYLLALALADIESSLARPAIEDEIMSIIVAACPGPEPTGDDDSAGDDGDDDSAGDDDDDSAAGDDHPDHTLIRLDLQLTDPGDWDLAGVIAEPSCACRLPRL